MFAEIIDRKAPYKRSSLLAEPRDDDHSKTEDDVNPDRRDSIEKEITRRNQSQNQSNIGDDFDPNRIEFVERQIAKRSRLDVTLDILGQQPLLKIYTQICLCYPLPPSESDIVQVTHTLESGLKRLAASFPWTAGQVVNENGTLKIVPFEKVPRFVVRDLREDAWSYKKMQEARFPFSMLDESVFCPRNTLPGMPGETEEQRTIFPVLYVQASIVEGGLVLSFAAHHGTMDMTGQGQVMELLSKACSDKPFTDEELSIGNVDRTNTIPYLEESWQPGNELEHQIKKPPTDVAAGPDGIPEESSPSPSTWAYFSLSPESLTGLKIRASEDLFGDVGYVSTDDTVTAFVWQSTMRARLPRLAATSKATFARAVDVRRYLGISPEYPGLLQNMTYHSSPIEELLGEKLGVIASHFRMLVDNKRSTLAHETQALATLMHRSEDKSNISFTATLNLSTDIMLSSWAKVSCYSLDFGLGLGAPEAVRRPQFTAVESLMYFMPKRLDGEIVLGLCLRDEDMERLKSDEEFAKYAAYIG